MTELSIIIVNWKSVDYLRECLESVYRQTVSIRFEVIVVDNASGDDCGLMLQKEFPEVRFIASSKNLGFAKANNLGYLSACGEYILFLNPDTQVNDDSLSAMVEFLRGRAAVGAAGARLLNSDGSLQSSCVQAFPTIINQALDSEFLRNLFPKSKLWGMQSLFDSKRMAAEVETISGACFMVRRSAFEAAGRFSEEYFMYSDDLDLSYKIKKAGYQNVCLPYCQVIHHGGKSSDRQSAGFANVLQCQSMDRFFRKSHGAIYSAAYRAAMAGNAVARLIASICLGPVVLIFGRKWDAAATRRKWFVILRWAIGQESWAGAIGKHADA